MKPLTPVRPRAGSRSASPSSCCSSPSGRGDLRGFVSRTFLADPLTMLREGWALFAEHGFAFDVGMTVWRVVGGFVLAAVLACRWGSRWARTSRSRPSSSRSCRSRAIFPRRRSSAADPVGGHRRDAEAAGHLHRLVLPDRADDRGDVGATRRDWSRPPTRWAPRRAASSAACCCRAPRGDRRDAAAGPGWAWTYVIVAELIGASSGIGHMITTARRCSTPARSSSASS